MVSLEDTEYTIVITDSLLLHENGEHEWQPVYFEIRNSGQGYALATGLRIDGTWWNAATIGAEYPGARTEIKEQHLRYICPDVAVDHLLTKITL